MRKNMIIFICILFLSFNSYATETKYVISAYKFTEESIAMNVYDNLSGSLYNLGTSESEKSESLDITKYLTPLLYTGSDKIADPISQSVFTVFVVGTESINNTEARSYSVSISLSPFIHDANSSIIPVYYEVVNTGTEYLGSADSPVSISPASGGTSAATANSSTPVELGYAWSVQRTADSAPNVIAWEAKCSIAAAISSADYDSADIGAYSANVTITLEVN